MTGLKAATDACRNLRGEMQLSPIPIRDTFVAATSERELTKPHTESYAPYGNLFEVQIIDALPDSLAPVSIVGEIK